MSRLNKLVNGQQDQKILYENLWAGIIKRSRKLDNVSIPADLLLGSMVS